MSNTLTKSLGLTVAAAAVFTIGAQATTHTFTVFLDGSKEVPPVVTTATGTGIVTLDDVTGMVTLTGTYSGLSANISGSHIHGMAVNECSNAGVILPLTNTGGTSGSLSGSGTLNPALVAAMIDGRTYINVHSGMFPGGEIRGQVKNGEQFCEDCDGSLVVCPCANPGADNSGCDNAQGTGGVRLTAPAWTPDGFGGGTATFAGSGYPPAGTPTSIVIRSPGSIPATPFGDGLLCLQPPVVRFGATAAIAGSSTHAVNHGAGAGDYSYQLWYRNTPASFCVTTGTSSGAFNLSNGLQLTW